MASLGDMESLKDDLLYLLLLLQNLNPAHLATICQFMQHTPEALSMEELAQLLTQVTEARLSKLITLSSGGGAGETTNSTTTNNASTSGLGGALTSSTCSTASEQQADKSGVGGREDMELVAMATQQQQQVVATGTPYSEQEQEREAELWARQQANEIVVALGHLMQLYHLQQVLSKLSIMQLMKLFEFVPPGGQVQQLQLLQQLQQLLGQLLPDTLLNLQSEVTKTSPQQEQHVLANLLHLRKEHFHLYQPLRHILQLDPNELLALRDVLPTLLPAQMLQLLSLLQLQPFDVLELKRLLTAVQPQPPPPLLPSSSSAASSSSGALPPEVAPQHKKLLLKIVEQPPEKSVYKRNLKPNPTVQVVEEEEASSEQNLFVAPVLLRCDTLEEQPKLMTGNKPVKVAPGRVISFRRLKITSTSHQQGESLFAIKFELRKYHNNEYEILDSVQSNPICVLSHSTQLKPASTTTPAVAEVIPYSGSSLGGTRVAVLGNNFVDSPSSKVRFDNTDVMPTFHGPRTLICITPQHQPGIVSVRVSNDSKVWSPTAASFTYEDKRMAAEQIQVAEIHHHFDLGLDIASSICEAAWQGGYETVKDLRERGANPNVVDERGYTALHYASSLGYEEIAQYLMDFGAKIDKRDNNGNTPLCWAAFWGHIRVVESLVEQGADMNLSNYEGLTPLHLAVTYGHQEMVLFLADHGSMLNAATLHGDTPLHRAAALGYEDIVLSLLQHGAFLDPRDDNGETPLHYAAREGCLSTVRALINAGADPCLFNADRETALHVATSSGHLDIVKLLVSRGIPSLLVSRDIFGATPLHHAFSGNWLEGASFLLENGADPNATDVYGQTPFNYLSDQPQYSGCGTITLTSSFGNWLLDQYQHYAPLSAKLQRGNSGQPFRWGGSYPSSPLAEDGGNINYSALLESKIAEERRLLDPMVKMMTDLAPPSSQPLAVGSAADAAMGQRQRTFSTNSVHRKMCK
ncbi:26S proteasome non-ATPase regulatory subunit 10 [Balamuthia mandrillaris]